MCGVNRERRSQRTAADDLSKLDDLERVIIVERRRGPADIG
jgi:hypothetical protein